MRFLALALCFLGYVSSAYGQQVIYINAKAGPGGDGTSWSQAFRGLQHGLQYARDHPSVQQIWVAEGVYYPTNGNDQSISFDLVDGVDVYGGFAGTEQTPEARDWTAHPTILSGAINGGNNSSARIVQAEDVTVTLDGLTIIGEGSQRKAGIGISALRSHLTLRRMIVEKNGYDNSPQSGGLHMEEGTADIEEVTFRHNSVSGHGGGMRVKNATASLRNVHFEDNDTLGGYGGGLHAENSTITIKDAQFVGNVSEGYGQGGAINMDGGSLQVNNTLFKGNRAWGTGSDGGAIYISAKGATTPSNIVNSYFIGNVAQSTTGSMGGGLYYYGAGTGLPLVVANAVFFYNIASGDYAAVGAVASHDTGLIHLINAVLIRNTSAKSDLINDPDILVSGPVALCNAIVWDNRGELFLAPSTPPGSEGVRYSIVQNGYAGTNVLNADPQFVRMPDAGPDTRWGTEDDVEGDYHLQQTSPAINSGTIDCLPKDVFDLDQDGNVEELLSLDLDGNPRVQGAEVDLGPFEYPNPTIIEPVPTTAITTLEVYPNPAHAFVKVNVELAKAATAQTSLYDMLGRHVATIHEGILGTGLQTLHLDSQALAPGVYFVHLRVGTILRVNPVVIY